VVPITIKDLNGTSLVFSPKAWIIKPTNLGYAKSITNREWKFDCSDLSIFTGGNPTGV
jgi:hypothetical protein